MKLWIIYAMKLTFPGYGTYGITSGASLSAFLDILGAGKGKQTCWNQRSSKSSSTNSS
jgi:hypothetical protein